jgi:hypothetical protein
MANITANNPMVLDTAGTTNLGQSFPMKVTKIVWEGTTIVQGDQLLITSGDGTSALIERTVGLQDVGSASTSQSITIDFTSNPRILPVLNAGGWKLTTMTHGKITLYYI